MTSYKHEYGPLNHKPKVYGKSLGGLDLVFFGNRSAEILIIGSIHGDESLTTVLLSECLRSLEEGELKEAVILSANPDGVLAGTRCNTTGVDLNRNFPTLNWKPDPVYYRNRPEDAQNIALSPGSGGGSEPESRALVQLVEQIKPRLIVSLHGFLNCIDDPDASAIALDLAERTQMELVPDVGYSTPGSFGSWCAEQNIPIITYELPSMAIVPMKASHIPVLRDLMIGYYRPLLRV